MENKTKNKEMDITFMRRTDRRTRRDIIRKIISREDEIQNLHIVRKNEMKQL
jgi:hypothetical protein